MLARHVKSTTNHKVTPTGPMVSGFVTVTLNSSNTVETMVHTITTPNQASTVTNFSRLSCTYYYTKITRLVCLTAIGAGDL
jgi:hypothetical protein